MTAVTTGERTALKEWAVLCDAMARGDIIAMVRKGGIREQRAGFAVRHDRFVLYPTFFHERLDELAPRFRDTLTASHGFQRVPSGQPGLLRLTLVADVAAVWKVEELERLRAIEHEHGLAWTAVESRFNYRGIPGVHVVAVRVSRLREAAEVPERRRYAGCVSWVELDGEIDVTAAVLTVPVDTFAARVAQLHASLGEAVA